MFLIKEKGKKSSLRVSSLFFFFILSFSLVSAVAIDNSRIPLLRDDDVSWYDLVNVPAGFADNIDNVSAGAPGNPFDQVLNTTSNVAFANVTVTNNLSADWFFGKIISLQGYFTNLNVTNLGGWSPITVGSEVIFKEDTQFESLLSCPVVYTNASGNTFCTDYLNITNLNVTNLEFEFLNVTVNATDVEDIWVNETGDNMTGDLNISTGNRLRVNNIRPVSGISLNFTFDVDDPQKAVIWMENLGDGDMVWRFFSPVGGSIIYSDDFEAGHEVRTPWIESSGDMVINALHNTANTTVTLYNSLTPFAFLDVEGGLDVGFNIFASGTICDGSGFCIHNLTQGIWDNVSNVATYDGNVNITNDLDVGEDLTVDGNLILGDGFWGSRQTICFWDGKMLNDGYVPSNSVVCSGTVCFKTNYAGSILGLNVIDATACSLSCNPSTIGIRINGGSNVLQVTTASSTALEELKNSTTRRTSTFSASDTISLYYDESVVSPLTSITLSACVEVQYDK